MTYFKVAYQLNFNYYKHFVLLVNHYMMLLKRLLCLFYWELENIVKHPNLIKQFKEHHFQINYQNCLEGFLTFNLKVKTL